jgi:uncharacterized protein YdhG (YjbR/CyaY superfamily)
MKAPKDIDEYIAASPKNVREKLQDIRRAIRTEAPNAKEVISYGMPAFKQNGVLVFFAAHKEHIGFYPTSSGISAFRDELSRYKQSKGAVQFPLDEEVPLDTIRKIVRFRVNEDKAKARKKI